MEFNYASILGWAIASIGIFISWFGSKPTKDQEAESSVFGSLIFAIFIAIPLTLISIFSNSFCIAHGLCLSEGDANMSHWFNPILLSPVYFIVSLKRSST
jgi:hypothetical protein